ncbi:hypothetical protein H696_02757 [Fonticula alba]|uniref:Clu domain-containing protein n=1 Tax=Fonticula alba TaxID=691883 RepID=A0A058Z909_FONAL|nr:hypothetical protein H696_02757 [Fonticula alba]KCV70413.1 hypothetical protein H696_02757 [Fonticula alba]|eukprot:XP_009494929.1 hypothetical protein H696_02757 [Fonticula alba]
MCAAPGPEAGRAQAPRPANPPAATGPSSQNPVLFESWVEVEPKWSFETWRRRRLILTDRSLLLVDASVPAPRAAALSTLGAAVGEPHASGVLSQFPVQLVTLVAPARQILDDKTAPGPLRAQLARLDARLAARVFVVEADAGERKHSGIGQLAQRLRGADPKAKLRRRLVMAARDANDCERWVGVLRQTCQHLSGSFSSSAGLADVSLEAAARLTLPRLEQAMPADTFARLGDPAGSCFGGSLVGGVVDDITLYGIRPAVLPHSELAVYEAYFRGFLDPEALSSAVPLEALGADAQAAASIVSGRMRGDWQARFERVLSDRRLTPGARAVSLARLCGAFGDSARSAVVSLVDGLAVGRAGTDAGVSLDSLSPHQAIRSSCGTMDLFFAADYRRALLEDARRRRERRTIDATSGMTLLGADSGDDSDDSADDEDHPFDHDDTLSDAGSESDGADSGPEDSEAGARPSRPAPGPGVVVRTVSPGKRARGAAGSAPGPETARLADEVLHAVNIGIWHKEAQQEFSGAAAAVAALAALTPGPEDDAPPGPCAADLLTVPMCCLVDFKGFRVFCRAVLSDGDEQPRFSAVDLAAHEQQAARAVAAVLGLVSAQDLLAEGPAASNAAPISASIVAKRLLNPVHRQRPAVDAPGGDAESPGLPSQPPAFLTGLSTLLPNTPPWHGTELPSAGEVRTSEGQRDQALRALDQHRRFRAELLLSRAGSAPVALSPEESLCVDAFRPTATVALAAANAAAATTALPSANGPAGPRQRRLQARLDAASLREGTAEREARLRALAADLAALAFIPADGSALVAEMHARGLNVRDVGWLLASAAVPAYVRRMCLVEMLARAGKYLVLGRLRVAAVRGTRGRHAPVALLRRDAARSEKAAVRALVAATNKMLVKNPASDRFYKRKVIPLLCLLFPDAGVLFAERASRRASLARDQLCPRALALALARVCQFSLRPGALSGTGTPVLQSADIAGFTVRAKPLSRLVTPVPGTEHDAPGAGSASGDLLTERACAHWLVTDTLAAGAFDLHARRRALTGPSLVRMARALAASGRPDSGGFLARAALGAALALSGAALDPATRDTGEPGRSAQAEDRLLAPSLPLGSGPCAAFIPAACALMDCLRDELLAGDFRLPPEDEWRAMAAAGPEADGPLGAETWAQGQVGRVYATALRLVEREWAVRPVRAKDAALDPAPHALLFQVHASAAGVFLAAAEYDRRARVAALLAQAAAGPEDSEQASHEEGKQRGADARPGALPPLVQPAELAEDQLRPGPRFLAAHLASQRVADTLLAPVGPAGQALRGQLAQVSATALAAVGRHAEACGHFARALDPAGADADLEALEQQAELAISHARSLLHWARDTRRQEEQQQQQQRRPAAAAAGSSTQGPDPSSERLVARAKHAAVDGLRHFQTLYQTPLSPQQLHSQRIGDLVVGLASGFILTAQVSGFDFLEAGWPAPAAVLSLARSSEGARRLALAVSRLDRAYQLLTTGRDTASGPGAAGGNLPPRGHSEDALTAWAAAEAAGPPSDPGAQSLTWKRHLLEVVRCLVTLRRVQVEGSLDGGPGAAAGAGSGTGLASATTLLAHPPAWLCSSRSWRTGCGAGPGCLNISGRCVAWPTAAVDSLLRDLHEEGPLAFINSRLDRVACLPAVLAPSAGHSAPGAVDETLPAAPARALRELRMLFRLVGATTVGVAADGS